VFLLVFVSTFPVVIPFIFMHNPLAALRCSNAIAISMLFILGYAFGRCSGFPPWITGVVMVILGAALVGITMVLGG
jgi:VIT1/CCC1 family predicted Fe2+/Mn2+ transporter